MKQKFLIDSTCGFSSEWMLDTGCYFHVSPNRQWFQESKQIDGGKVLLENHKKMQ